MFNDIPCHNMFKGAGGPEDDVKIQAENRGGDQEVPDTQGLKRHELKRSSAV
jgi:hypothetical protein